MGQKSEICNGLISEKMTRDEIGKQTGLKGKELTAYIKNMQMCDCLVAMFSHLQPAKTKKRTKVCAFVAHQTSIMF